MSPLKKVIIATAISGVVSAGLFVACGIFLTVRYVTEAFWIGFSLTGNRHADTAIDMAAEMGFWLSLMICPFCAYYVRDSVLELTPVHLKRVLIFSLISTFQIITLSVGYVSFATYTKISADRSRQKTIEDNKAHQTVLDELKSANIEVIADDARIVGDDGNLVVADVTFQIRNVPFVVPYYDVSLLPTPNDIQLSYKLHNFPDKLNKPPDGPDQRRSIKARNEGGRWVFYKSFTDERISDDSDKISLQIEIAHLRPSMLQVTTTITPQLTAWSEENGYWRERVFWSKPIPLTIRRF